MCRTVNINDEIIVVSEGKKDIGKFAILGNDGKFDPSVIPVIDELQDQINKEATERIEGDKALQINIDAEASTRATADRDLQDQITKEVMVRTEGDKTLQTNIDTEVSARTVADQQLQDQINKEVTERIEGDKALQINIDTEVSARTVADQQLQDKINKEVTERIEGDNALQTNIDAEASARTVADQQLQSQISKEVTERIEGDKTLQTNIDTLKNEVALLAFPVGGIIAWNGSAASIPSGWSLCDGTNGTPNLGNRFILGAGDKYKVGQTGGEEAHILTVAEMPAHNHTFKDPYDQAGMDVGTDKSGGQRQRLCCGDNPPYGNILYTGELNLAGESQPHTNMPPYYALAYIMKVA